MVALFENGVTDATRRIAVSGGRNRSSQSLATSVSLLSSTASCASLSAMPRLTVPTKPRLCSFSSNTMRLSLRLASRSHSVTSGSGLASFITTSRQGVAQRLDRTESIQRRVSSSPRYTGTITSTMSARGAAVCGAGSAAAGLGRAPAQQPLERHLGVDQRPGGAEHRRILDPAQVIAQSVVSPSRAGSIGLPARVAVGPSGFVPGPVAGVARSGRAVARDPAGAFPLPSAAPAFAEPADGSRSTGADAARTGRSTDRPARVGVPRVRRHGLWRWR